MLEQRPDSVLLTRVGMNYEATLLAGRLKAHSVDVVIEELIAYDDAAGNSGIRVWVPEAQLKQAQEILAELEAARDTLTESELERQAMKAGEVVETRETPRAED